MATTACLSEDLFMTSATVPETVARWAYRSLPRTNGANRFDRTWRAFGWHLRVYVGEMTRHHASWHACLSRGEFSVDIRATGERIGRGTYSGPEPSTRASCDVQENWTFPRRWRWCGRDKYGWCRFNLGHAWFTVRSPRMWSVGYLSQHLEVHGRLRKAKG
jgi:hypothetical protein